MGIIKKIHHVELVTKNLQSISWYLRNSFGFRLILKKENVNILQSGEAIFIIKSMEIDDFSSIDSVYDIALEVFDVGKIINFAIENKIPITREKERIKDFQGYIEIAQIKSCVGNVVHTLIDKQHYHGYFLPGYDTKFIECQINEELVKNFDHITYAVEKNSSNFILKWYSDVFKMTRKFINKKESIDQGFVVHHKTSGLRLKAFEYWQCDETCVNNHNDSCKFVIAEELNDSVKNQIGKFLQEHQGPGIQHIGLSVSDIVQTSQTCNDNGAQFIIPPSQYYEIIGRNSKIQKLDFSLPLLAKNGILIDIETESTDDENNDTDGILLQVFTKPFFDRNTFFLELIERCGAEGFGSGNIESLWKAYESFIESNDLLTKTKSN